ncbi:MAG TPA: PRC-barrel domain-containing protein [Dermatophilaceae bacterium]|nr:PRC-barrel domain-containing protein [Dermatophilaceae bacterium]
MSLLVKASELTKRPVVTLSGDDVAQVKDVVFDSSGGSVVGVTLAGRGLFAGPLKEVLPWSAVLACGRDAVMVADEGALAEREDVVEAVAGGPDVLGSRVITDGGTELGKVVDVVIEVGDEHGRRTEADVVGYEVASGPATGRPGRHVYIPLPDTLSVSGEALMVPAAATEFVCDDLAGFGAAVDAFRARLRGGR